MEGHSIVSARRESVGIARARRPGLGRALGRGLGTVRRRLLASREALECAALLILVLGVTLGASWVAWQHLIDQRVRLAPAQTAPGAPAPTSDIVDHDSGRSSITSAPPSGSTIQQPSARTPDRHSSSSSGEAVTVSGPQLAVGAVTGTLIVGLSVSLWIHRRYRGGIQNRAETAATGIPEHHPDDVPSGLQEPSTGRPQLESPAAPRSVTQSRTATRRPSTTRHSHSPLPTSNEGRHDPLHDTQNQLPAPHRAEGSHSSGSSVQVGASDRGRRVLLDRRAYDRVPFEHVAQLHWRETNQEITTVDLSEAGVRIHLERSPTERVTGVPSVGEWVDVVIPLGDSKMRLNTEVINRTSTAGGTDIGLAFKNLPEHQQQRLRAAVLSLRLWGPSTP